jgi:F-type H+-transporting ATPase subunit delta
MHKRDVHDLDPTRAPSVFDVDVLRIARVYAAALFGAAEKVGKADEFQQTFDTLFGNPLKQEPGQADLGPLLTGSLVPRGRREEMIRKAFSGRVDDTFVNFLLVLNKHNRLDLIRPIAAMFRQVRDERLRRVRVVVRSAVPLSDKQREEVARLAQERFHLQPVLVETVDPDLLGGLQLQVGDRMVDLSVRSRLNALRQQMIERSTHEIQRRRDRVGPAV